MNDGIIWFIDARVLKVNNHLFDFHNNYQQLFHKIPGLKDSCHQHVILGHKINHQQNHKSLAWAKNNETNDTFYTQNYWASLRSINIRWNPTASRSCHNFPRRWQSRWNWGTWRRPCETWGWPVSGPRRASKPWASCRLRQIQSAKNQPGDFVQRL